MARNAHKISHIFLAAANFPTKKVTEVPTLLPLAEAHLSSFLLFS